MYPGYASQYIFPVIVEKLLVEGFLWLKEKPFTAPAAYQTNRVLFYSFIWILNEEAK